VQDPYREALLLNRAAVLFEQAGQPLDAARCRERAHTQVSLRGA
jgi:hypothetical protein